MRCPARCSRGRPRRSRKIDQTLPLAAAPARRLSRRRRRPISISSSATSGPIEYLYHHRGVTHSLDPAAAVGVPAGEAVRRGLAPRPAVARLFRRHRDGPRHSHRGRLDHVVRHDGVRAALRCALRASAPPSSSISGSPASSSQGSLACVVWRASPVPAVAGLAALCGYIAFQGVQQQRAIEWGEAYARDSRD